MPLLLLITAASAMTPAEAFQKLSDSDLEVAVTQLKKGLPSKTPAAPPAPWSVMSSFADTSGASWSELLSAAVSVSDEDDVEAGLDIQPFALAGMDGPIAGATVHFAALEDGTRLGVAVPLKHGRSFSLADLGLVQQHSAEAEAKIAATNAAYRTDWVAACDAIMASGITPTDGAGRFWDEARRTCSNPAPGDTFEGHVGSIETFFATQEKDVANDPEKAASLAGLKVAADPIIKRVRATDGVPFLEGVTSEKVEAAYQQAVWDSVRVHITPAARLSLAPLRWGYNPAPDTPLESGTLNELAAGVEIGVTRRRTTLALALEASSAGMGADAARTLAPTLSFAFLGGSLGDDPIVKEDGTVALRKKQDLTKAGPELGPHWSLGVNAGFAYLLNSDASHLSPFESVECTPFVDLHPSSTLAFRLGVPLKGETVTREADDTTDPPTTEESGLQFSVPVFLVTSLSI